MNTDTKIEHLKDKGIFGKCTWVSDRYQSMTPQGFTRYALSMDDDERQDNDSLASLEITDLNDAINVLKQISPVKFTTMEFLSASFDSLIDAGAEKFVLNIYKYWHSDSFENHQLRN